MLVLSRRKYEKIIINGNIEIEIVGRKGKNFKIGITAPKEVSIIREELQNKDNIERSKDANLHKSTGSIN